MTLEVRPLRDGEAAEAARHRTVSFGKAADDRLVERLGERIAAGELWGVADGARLLSSCSVSRADHWFGGRPVACQHIGAVAVPPEHRGRGVASALMRAVARNGAREGIGLSLLFPATTRLYRKLGWEHAGSYTRYRLAAWDAMPAGPRPSAMRVAQGDADWVAIRECFLRAAALASGVGARPDRTWEGLREAAYHYVLDGEEEGTVDAYVSFDHGHHPDDWRYRLEIRDWAAVTPDGLRAVVGLVASHGSLGKDARFVASHPDPWLLLIGEQEVKIDGALNWMARVLGPTEAIAQRGFPAGLSVSVTLTVTDALLPRAAGPWLLEIDGGRGTLKPAGRADVRLDARAFGPLFTGFRDPAQLALGGIADGPPESLALLAAAFAGPPPYMIDFF